MNRITALEMRLATTQLLVIVMSVMVYTRGQVMSELLPRGTDSTSPVATRLLTILNKYDARINETTPQLIKSNGYPVESHQVTTEDGYILELHRIPCSGKEGAAAEGANRYKLRPVAFLHHCLLCSSSDFIMNTPDKALGYVLADAGYDVWMTNARGNTYSRKHLTLSPQHKHFWQFSWTEMAKYDVPAAIDYILNVTYNKDLYYVGFSMGTTIFWAMLNEHPHYASKVRTQHIIC
ncbi:lipase 3 [Cherax quadricarinatus]|uniref:lipase 3 n=1 Tax=Cherax quadricarinatus TaxID=27406 RepID=UPI00387E625F